MGFLRDPNQFYTKSKSIIPLDFEQKQSTKVYGQTT